MKTVTMEKAKALLIVTLLLVTFLVGSEAAGRELKPKEEVYTPQWFWGWGFPWWGLGHGFGWGFHPWLGGLNHGLKDAPHGYGGKGDIPYDHNKGNGKGDGDGNGEKGDIPDHGGDGQNGDGGKYP
ncbi:hypothetical protein ABKV19_017971 [Rosa sericea]